jgi:hypothetical protein
MIVRAQAALQPSVCNEVDRSEAVLRFVLNKKKRACGNLRRRAGT